jgi:hypothetical protein
MNIGSCTSIKELGEHLGVIERRLTRLSAERFTILARIRELEKQQGASPRQTASTIANMSRCSPHQAAGELVLAEKLASLPGIAKAHRNGDISNGQIAAAADIATPETEDETIEFVKNASSADLDRQAAISRGKLTEERQAAHANRYLAFKGENGSSTRIHGRLPYAEAKQLEDQLRKIADRLELGEPKRSSPASRMADALLILTKHNPSASLHEHQKHRAKQQAEAASNLVSPLSKVSFLPRTIGREHDQRPSSPGSENVEPESSPGVNGTAHGKTSRSSEKPGSTFSATAKCSETFDPNNKSANDSNGVALKECCSPASSYSHVPPREQRQSIFGEGAFDYDEDPFPEPLQQTDTADLDLPGYETVGLFDDDININMLTHEPSGIDSSTVTIVQKADTRIIVHWDAATGVVRYENGPPIEHARLVALLCDAQLEVQHCDSTGQPTGLLTTAHNANWRQDRYLAYRDGPCRVPNCMGQGKTHAHHIFQDHENRSDRITDVRHMINLCNHNHNEHHEGKFEISGDPEGIITFTYPDGRQLHSSARIVPPKAKPKSVHSKQEHRNDKSA